MSAFFLKKILLEGQGDHILPIKKTKDAPKSQKSNGKLFEGLRGKKEGGD